jgi:uncharacterized protein YraI
MEQATQDEQEQLQSVNFNVRVTGSSVHVRIGPGTNYHNVGTVNRGLELTVMAEAQGQGGDGHWLMVIAGENGAQSGWISRKHTESA